MAGLVLSKLDPNFWVYTNLLKLVDACYLMHQQNGRVMITQRFIIKNKSMKLVRRDVPAKIACTVSWTIPFSSTCLYEGALIGFEAISVVYNLIIIMTLILSDWFESEISWFFDGHNDEREVL